MSETKNKRNTSIELLRILSMLMIIVHHFAQYNLGAFSDTMITLPRMWNYFLFMWGKVGVDIFLIISGYYMITDKSPVVSIKKVLKYMGQIVFYSAGFYVAWGLLHLNEMSINEMIKFCFPITNSMWWFATVYFIILIIHPYLNKLLTGINKADYQKILIFGLVIWSIIPIFIDSNFQSSKLMWGIYLYCLAGYIRLYGLRNNWNMVRWIVIAVITIIITYVFACLMSYWGISDSKYIEYITLLYTQEYLAVLLISLSLFMVFINVNMAYNKIVNVIASATFGVYLFHEHGYVKYILWNNIFISEEYRNDYRFVLFSLVVGTCVFLLGVIIDLIRQIIFEKPFMLIISKNEDRIIASSKKIYSFFKSIIFGND